MKLKNVRKLSSVQVPQIERDCRYYLVLAEVLKQELVLIAEALLSHSHRDVQEV